MSAKLKSKNSTLSLNRHCLPCGSRCCYYKDGIGSPILDKKEMKSLKIFIKKHLSEKTNLIQEIKFNDKNFYVIGSRNKRACAFLKGNKCQLQPVKPLDCLIYPIKAIPENENIIFVLDRSCPASKNLTLEFIRETKKLALKSINRFDAQTYQYWLANFVRWPLSKKTKRI